MNIFNLVFGVIATIRLSDILELEKIAYPIRDYFGIGHNKNKEPLTPSALEGVKGFFGSLMWCWKCISVWVSAFFAICYLTNKTLYKFLTLTFGFSWLAITLSRILSKTEKKLL